MTNGENVPEQGPGQFLGSGSQRWLVKELVSCFHVRAPFLCQQHMWYQTPCSPPLCDRVECQHPEVAQPHSLTRPSAQRRGSSASNPPTKESLPAPGGGQGSTEHALNNEVVKDPVRFWQFPFHNVCFWVNTMFSDGPNSSLFMLLKSS